MSDFWNNNKDSIKSGAGKVAKGAGKATKYGFKTGKNAYNSHKNGGSSTTKEDKEDSPPLEVRPISQLKDPHSFAPPPRHVAITGTPVSYSNEAAQAQQQQPAPPRYQHYQPQQQPAQSVLQYGSQQQTAPPSIPQRQLQQAPSPAPAANQYITQQQYPAQGGITITGDQLRQMGSLAGSFMNSQQSQQQQSVSGQFQGQPGTQQQQQPQAGAGITITTDQLKQAGALAGTFMNSQQQQQQQQQQPNQVQQPYQLQSAQPAYQTPQSSQAQPTPSNLVSLSDPYHHPPQSPVSAQSNTTVAPPPIAPRDYGTHTMAQPDVSAPVQQIVPSTTTTELYTPVGTPAHPQFESRASPSIPARAVPTLPTRNPPAPPARAFTVTANTPSTLSSATQKPDQEKKNPNSSLAIPQERDLSVFEKNKPDFYKEVIEEPKFKTNLMDFDLNKFGAPPPKPHLYETEKQKQERDRQAKIRLQNIKQESLYKAKQAHSGTTPTGSQSGSSKSSRLGSPQPTGGQALSMSSIDASIRPPPAIPSRESSDGASGTSESETETNEKRPPEPKKFNLVDISKIQPPPPINRGKPSIPSATNRVGTDGHQTGTRTAPPPPPARTLPKPPRSESTKFGGRISSPSPDAEEPPKPKKFNLIDVSSIGPPPPKNPPLRKNEHDAEKNNKNYSTSSYGTNRFSHSHSPVSPNLSGSSSPSPYPDHPPPAYSTFNHSATNGHSPSAAPALPARHTPMSAGASSTASSNVNVPAHKKAPPPKPVKRKSVISEAHLLVDITGGSMKSGSPIASDHPPVKPPRPSTKPVKPLKPMKPNKVIPPKPPKRSSVIGGISSSSGDLQSISSPGVASHVGSFDSAGTNNNVNGKKKPVAPPRKPTKRLSGFGGVGAGFGDSSSLGNAESSAKGNHIKELQARLSGLNTDN
ncbi:unnamed protein product [Ambrosiozyma monospora]|uniref:Unnamed protein product n=1 Tax=Ambrosiozyma monospora TaxID=43982 RepID=A0A9W7DEG7_AMBMO|nr:unnamed protein product [Ambrosiozyma monospora]